MKKLVNILSVVSIFAVILGCALLPFLLGRDQRISFISLWFLSILLLLAVPFLLGALSLACNKDKFSPKAWLAIYSVIVVLYIIGAMHFGFLDYTHDLPMAFRKDYISIEGEAQIISATRYNQVIRIANYEFILSKNVFIEISRNSGYKLYYLPNSKYVVNVISEDGQSLLKR